MFRGHGKKQENCETGRNCIDGESKWKRSKRERSVYTEYRFSAGEAIRYGAEGIVLTGALAYLFYNCVAAMVCLSPICIVYLRRKKKQLLEKQTEDLKRQFKEALLSVSMAMQVGYSMENAWREAHREMKLLYGENAAICKELKQIILRLDMNETIEEILEAFAERTNIEDIKVFSDIVGFAKRSGGNFVKIIGTTVNQMGDKIDVDREIQTLTAAKRMEQKIMSVVPLGMILYLRMGSPGYLDNMYTTVWGTALMTICLMVYFGACWLGQRIVRIEV